MQSISTTKACDTPQSFLKILQNQQNSKKNSNIYQILEISYININGLYLSIFSFIDTECALYFFIYSKFTFTVIYILYTAFFPFISIYLF